MTKVSSESSPQRPAWRTDIEGLRGIAVLLVVLYHTGVPGFAGGYIGVDVFFVLSGYLITGILVKEAQAKGSIDLMRFYARRAKRLLPASAALLAFIVVFALLFYAPLEQADIAKTAIATAAYVSNVYFGQNATDYLAAEAETNPLLHTWSLSVEEQFYVVWPALVLVFLFGLAGFRKKDPKAAKPSFSQTRLVWGTAIIAALSFGLTLYLMNTGRTHWAFFSSPTRAWEFALGGLGALLPVVGNTQRGLTGLTFGRFSKHVPLVTQALGWLGLAVMLATGFMYTAATPFPGWAAVLPVLGTVFILRAGVANSESWLTKVLSVRPLRELGRLSYSWYLWHWPPLVFAAGLYGELLLSHKLVIMVVSLGLAELSYRLIENPVRHNKALGRKHAYGMALLLGVTVFSLVLSGGWWQITQNVLKSPRQIQYTNAGDDLPNLYARNCQVETLDVKPTSCVDGPDDAPYTVVLFGDSHASHWAPALQTISSEQGWKLLYFTKAGCPGIEITRYHEILGRTYTECDEWRKIVLKNFQVIKPDLIVMSANSTYGSFGEQEWVSGSRKTFEKLSEAANAVVFIRDTPRSKSNIPACLSRLAWQDTIGIPFRVGQQNCEIELYTDDNVIAFTAQQEAADEFDNVNVIDITPVICPNNECSAELGEYIVFRDDDHLSASYVRSITNDVSKAIGAVVENYH